MTPDVASTHHFSFLQNEPIADQDVPANSLETPDDITGRIKRLASEEVAQYFPSDSSWPYPASLRNPLFEGVDFSDASSTAAAEFDDDKSYGSSQRPLAGSRKRRAEITQQDLDAKREAHEKQMRLNPLWWMPQSRKSDSREGKGGDKTVIEKYCFEQALYRFAEAQAVPVRPPDPRLALIKQYSAMSMDSSRMYQEARRILAALAQDGIPPQKQYLLPLECLLRAQGKLLDYRSIYNLSELIFDAPREALGPQERVWAMGYLYQFGQDDLDEYVIGIQCGKILALQPKDLPEEMLGYLYEFGSRHLWHCAGKQADAIATAPTLDAEGRSLALRSLYWYVHDENRPSLDFFISNERQRILGAKHAVFEQFRVDVLASLYGNGAKILPGRIVAQERAALLDPRERVKGRDNLDEFDKIRLVRILYRNLSAEDSKNELTALSVLSQNQTNPQALATHKTLSDYLQGRDRDELPAVGGKAFRTPSLLAGE